MLNKRNSPVKERSETKKVSSHIVKGLECHGGLTQVPVAWMSSNPLILLQPPFPLISKFPKITTSAPCCVESSMSLYSSLGSFPNIFRVLKSEELSQGLPVPFTTSCSHFLLVVIDGSSTFYTASLLIDSALILLFSQSSYGSWENFFFYLIALTVWNR